MCDKKTIVYLSDQNEFKGYAEALSKSSIETNNILINTIPFPEESFSDKFTRHFSQIFDWWSLFDGAAFNLYEQRYYTFDWLARVLKEAHWPQDINEILATQQNAHRKLSGRLYQEKTFECKAINSFGLTHDMCEAVIKAENVDLAYTYAVKDPAKIGAVCAFLKNDIEVVESIPTNVSDNRLKKIITCGAVGLQSTYCGHYNSSISPLFECVERGSECSENGATKMVDWRLCKPAILHLKKSSDGERSSGSRFDETRRYHYQEHRTNEPLAVKNSIRLGKRFMIESRVLSAELFGFLFDRDYVRPSREKSRLQRLFKRLVKAWWFLSCDLKSISDSLAVSLVKERKIRAETVVALHYFPESSTIGGLSWRGIKNEVDLFRQREIQDIFATCETCFVEHPVYLKLGQRPKYFWQCLRRAGYKNFVKRSRGLDIENLACSRVVTISGTCALEMAFYRTPAFVTKNTNLLLVEGVDHISTLLGDREWKINYGTAKIAPSAYVALLNHYGIRSPQSEIDFIIAALTRESHESRFGWRDGDDGGGNC